MKKILIFFILIFGFFQNVFAENLQNGLDRKGKLIIRSVGINNGNSFIFDVGNCTNGNSGYYCHFYVYNINGDLLKDINLKISNGTLSLKKVINLNNGGFLIISEAGHGDYHYPGFLYYNGNNNDVKYKDVGYISSSVLDLKIGLDIGDNKRFLLKYSSDDYVYYDIINNEVGDLRNVDIDVSRFFNIGGDNGLYNAGYIYNINADDIYKDLFYTFDNQQDLSIGFFDSKFDYKKNYGLSSFVSTNVNLEYYGDNDGKLNFGFSQKNKDTLFFQVSQNDLESVEVVGQVESKYLIGKKSDTEFLYYENNSNYITGSLDFTTFGYYNHNFGFYNYDSNIWQFNVDNNVIYNIDNSGVFESGNNGSGSGNITNNPNSMIDMDCPVEDFAGGLLTIDIPLTSYTVSPFSSFTCFFGVFKDSFKPIDNGLFGTGNTQISGVNRLHIDNSVNISTDNDFGGLKVGDIIVLLLLMMSGFLFFKLNKNG